MSDPSEKDALRLWLGLRAEPPSYRAYLRRLTGRGLRIAGVLGLLGVALYVGSKALLIAAPEIQGSDKVIIAAAALALIAGGRARCSLRIGRLLMGGAALCAAAASLYADVVRGFISVEYLSLMLLLAATTTPFRPWQTALLGVGFAGVLVVGGTYGPLWVTAAGRSAPILLEAHLVQIAVVSLLATGISALLYASRYRQHAARREAEALRDEVAELEAAKSRFYANVSHDLRTPLTLILGPLQDLLDGRHGDLPAPVVDRLTVVRRQAKRLRTLVEQLLRLSKLDEGQLTLNAQSIDLDAFLHRMKGLFRSMAERRSIALRVDVEARPTACADPKVLERILANLLSNALEHTPEDGTVRLEAAPLPPEATTDGERVAVTVRDSGPGLPPEVQASLFERYARGDAGRSERASGGTGIGLALAKELTERHNGRIDVDSAADRGTKITVLLPRRAAALPDEDLADDDASPPTPPPTPEEGASPSMPAAAAASGPDSARGPRREEAPSVLVVDDDARMRAYLTDVLGPRYAIRTAADGEAALEAVRRERPDLVVSDVVMPRRDGFELCRALRADETLRTLPIILLTVQDEDEHVLKGLRRGADAYLGKPFRPEALRQRVENLIDVRRYLRAASSASTPSPAEDDGPSIGPEEASSSLVQAARSVVEDHLDNSGFGVEWLADEVGLSARHLQRRLQEEAGLSAAAFIRAVRLQRARKLLSEGRVETVKAAAGAVGYRDASYFSQLFEDTHGHPPSDYTP